MAAKAEELNMASGGDIGGIGSPSSEKPSEPVAGPVTTDTTVHAPLTEKTETENVTQSADATATAIEPASVKAIENQTPVQIVSTSTPATHIVPTSETPIWPEIPASHPLTKFYDSFEDLVAKASYNEVYGIKLEKSNEFHTKLILQKFLRANQNDLEKAKQQLLETLQWRKDFDPVKAAGESFDRNRFEGLGYVLEVEGVLESLNEKDIVTFNVYGAVKDNETTFGDLEGFLRWRVGLMEKSVQKLPLKDATRPIPDFGEGPDPYQGYQIHDYLQASFLRRDAVVKTATNKTIETLGRYYPETLSRKFFVNVPVVMGWLYQAMKMVVAKETVKKFGVLSYGNQLVTELGPNIPQVYGGKLGELREVGEAMKLKE